MFFFFLWLYGLYSSFVITWSLIKKKARLWYFVSSFLNVWLIAIFSYNVLDSLISADGLVWWTNLKSVRPLIIWSSQVNQWLKWNVDGSSTRKPSDPGIDGVLRDHKGIVQCMNRSIPVGIKDSNEAEPIAVIKALELSSTREECIGKRIIIESDSSIVINRIIKEYNRPWKFHVLFILASRFSSGLRLVKYSHIYFKGG